MSSAWQWYENPYEDMINQENGYREITEEDSAPSVVEHQMRLYME